MENINHIEKIIDNLKPEHLAKGFNPIVICVDDIDHYTHSLSDDDIVASIKKANHIDYFKNRTTKNGIEALQGPESGYVISGIDKDSKYTNRLYSCTSIIAVGTDKKTGENISFISHQDPLTAVENVNFNNDIKRRVRELQARCQEGSVDIVLVGGQIQDEYEDVIYKLSDKIQEVAGFIPVVIGPKIDKKRHDNLFFDTKNRRAYLMRNGSQKDNVYNDTFRADNLDDMMSRWKNVK